MAKKRKDEKELLLMLSGGDMREYKEIQRLSVEDFLIKFERFVKDIERK